MQNFDSIFSDDFWMHPGSIAIKHSNLHTFSHTFFNMKSVQFEWLNGFSNNKKQEREGIFFFVQD